MDVEKWEYMEHDGAYFRKRADSGAYMVDEVYWPTKGWVPYSGERSRRYRTSSFVYEADALRECAAQTAHLKLEAADAIAAAMRAIVGAAAPPAPVRPRTVEVITHGRVFHLTPAEFKEWKPGGIPKQAPKAR